MVMLTNMLETKMKIKWMDQIGNQILKMTNKRNNDV